MTSSVQQLVGWVLFVQLKHWVVRIKSTELKFLQLPSVMVLGEKEVWYIEWCLIADRTLYIFRIFSISISQQIVVWWPIESEKFWSWLFNLIMAKSTRSKVKRSFRSKKCESGVYAATEAARLQRLNQKLQHVIGKDRDGDMKVDLIQENPGDSGWYWFVRSGLLDPDDITLDNLSSLHYDPNIWRGSILLNSMFPTQNA